MKNKFKLIVKLCSLFLGAVLFVSCQNESEEISVTEGSDTGNNQLSEQTLAKLEAMGFDIESTAPVATEEGVFVEGDLLISNELIEDFNFEKQAFASLITCDRVKNIRIKNDIRGNATARQGFNLGIRLWNRVNGSTLRLVPVTSGRVDILIRLANNREKRTSPLNTLSGIGEFPSKGRAGKLIRINPDNAETITGEPYNAQRYGRLIAHEIGHNIGFIHATPEDEGFFRATRVPGTPRGTDTDLSVMNPINTISRQLRFDNTTGLSRNDMKAVRRMYSDANNSLCRRWEDFEDLPD